MGPLLPCTRYVPAIGLVGGRGKAEGGEKTGSCSTQHEFPNLQSPPSAVSGRALNIDDNLTVSTPRLNELSRPSSHRIGDLA